VTQLQTELNTILGLSLPVDGTFGLATKSAVERFQQEHNVVPAEGIVGPQTKAALDNPGSSSAGTPGQLNPGQQITSGTQIASPDGKFVLQMQSDGNLVIRAPDNIPLRDTHTAGHDGTIAVMQTDGNFVLRAPGNIPVWSSGTDGHPGTVLQVQDDGNVVLYAPGHQALRVLFPAVPKPQNSVPTPAVPPVTAPTTAPGTSDGSGGANTAPANTAMPAQTSTNQQATASAVPGVPSGGISNEQYVTNCGITRCTKYFTRAATKRINANVQEQQNRIIVLGTAGPTVACAIAGAALGGGIGAAAASAACAVVSADKIASLVDALKQASDANQCFAMKAPKGLDNLSVVGLYASNYLVRSNQYCTDGN
jgi:peptidoglycan hydrolase-like protein with peptidoglycan-binding domain